MPRRGPAVKRDTEADPVYGSKLVGRLVSKVMQGGHKALAQKIVYDAFEIVREKGGGDPLTVFKKAVDNVKPMLQVRSRRVGGATYQVPVEVSARKGIALALRWIVGFCRERSGKPMAEKLAQEILDAAAGTGPSVKKKEDLHRMAEANRAFAHYRW